MATFMAGILVVAMGLARFGTLLTFIPYQLTVGFTSGIALIVFSSQLKDFSGPGIHPLPAGFAEKWGVNAAHAGSVNLTSRGADLASLVPVVV